MRNSKKDPVIRDQRSMKKKRWFEKGIRFSCQRCGDCCRNVSLQEACVYLNGDDIDGASELLHLSRKEFIKKYTVNRYSFTVIRKPEGDCIFFQNKKCCIYKARPMQCRTWPFWEINLIKKNWEQNVKPVCRGIGKGKLYSCEQIVHMSEFQSPL
ncbi:MAG: YkgJ family cysteine cluster protein [Spirochaetes bacterium]|nr:YkgJ family cysteine cluster protein [Spirochaetota bacterium]